MSSTNCNLRACRPAERIPRNAAPEEEFLKNIRIVMKMAVEETEPIKITPNNARRV